MRITSTGKTLTALAAAAALLAVAGCTGDGGEGGGEGGLADMEPIVLTSAEFGAEATAQGAGGHAFYDYIEEATDGKVTFEVYWGSSLFGGSETVANVGAGVADIGQFSTPFNPDDLPVSQYVLQSGIMADASYPLGYYQSSVATHELFAKNADIQADYADDNLFVLSALSTPRYGLLCSDKVSTPAEAVGKRTRVGGGAWVGEAEALGMATQFTPVPEIYEALQRGVLDCLVLPPSAFADLSFWEIAKHFVPTAFSNFPGAVRVINLDTWNSFPDELKKIFAEAVAYDFEANIQASLEALARFVADGAEEYDVQFYEPGPLDEVIIAHQEEAIAELPSNMPAVADPEGFLSQYEEYLGKWRDVFLEAGFTSAPDQTITNNAVAAPTDDAWKEPLVQAILQIADEVYGG